jgi:hypothetical protein
MKESIRKNLKMLEENLPMFNSHACQFIDKKVIKKFISIWRWYVSHGYFKEKHPQPKGLSSNPPIPWLNGQLIGQTTPLARDIGICIEPVVSSAIQTEGAARRIMNRLNMIYGYVTEEDAKADREAAYKKKVLDKLDAKKRADYERLRREKKKDPPKTWDPEQYLKMKNKQRQKTREDRKRREAESIRQFEEMEKRLKRRGN